MAETEGIKPGIKPVLSETPTKLQHGAESPREYFETYHENEDVLEGNETKFRGMLGYQKPRVVRRTVEKQRIVRR